VTANGTGGACDKDHGHKSGRSRVRRAWKFRHGQTVGSNVTSVLDLAVESLDQPVVTHEPDTAASIVVCLPSGAAAVVGLPPKTYARIERVRSVLARFSERDFARLAAELGYYDQSHLTNEFRAVMGVPPAAFADGQRLPPTPCLAVTTAAQQGLDLARGHQAQVEGPYGADPVEQQALPSRDDQSLDG
jgi:hypothetical protein